MLKNLAILAVCGAFLFVRPCVAEKQKGSAHTTHSKPNQTHQPVPPTHVVIDPPLPTLNPGQPEPAENQSTSPEKNLPRFERPEWVIVYITAVYVLISALTLWAIKRQADTMDRQATEARESATASALLAQGTLTAMKEQATHMYNQTLHLGSFASAAQQSADAAEISAKTAMGVSVPTLMLHEFAFLKIGAADNAAVLQWPHIRIVVKNYGATPAFLKAFCVTIACDDRLPDEPPYGEQYPFDSEIVVGSGQLFQLGEQYNESSILFSHPTPPDILKDLVEGKKIMRIFGYVRYGDIFGSPLREMRFCKALIELGHNDWNPLIVEDGGSKYHNQNPN